MANLAIRNTIENRNQEFMLRYNSGNAEGVSQLFSIDGEVLPPNADFVTGRDAIKKFWQAVMEMGIEQIQLKTSEVEHYGNTAIEVGNAILMNQNEEILDRSKYIVIWKLKGGEWKLHRDIFNSSLSDS
ncbi:DUF4440 domain-containing protein [Rhodohalobacter sp. SW132]|uniref:YybH family protein n=1 Tax=Rhodohalobacter sp. SW132 TaxID=2293433 RepID=UPI000E288C17|nr:DUF4440 domain-containing protein [Rhodohalobacter sp. SW132]REL33799.1 DUF4440 domain-containing protein [Rhodohalobacter sp. SW132]